MLEVLSIAPGMIDVGSGASSWLSPGTLGFGASPSDGWGTVEGRRVMGQLGGAGWPDGARLIKRDLGEGRPGQAAVAGGG